MDADLASLVPPIRRARGYRVYDHRGRRYLDLFLNNGGALLGHRPRRPTATMKNVMAKGLAAELPSVYRDRLAKELLARFPDFREVVVTTSLRCALAVASRYLGRRIDPEDVFDPARSVAARVVPVAFWRPFIPGQVPSCDALIPLIPCAMGGSPVALCLKEKLPEGFHGEGISPALLAGALRALHDLDRIQWPDRLAHGFLDGCHGWAQRGCYVTATFDCPRYPMVFRQFLDKGLILSPFFPGPSILPAEASEGELDLLHTMFSNVPGGATV